jgi:hypothetical protein
MNPTIAEQDEVVVGSVEQAPSVRWALASLSLSMLLSSLGTSIANVALPTWHRRSMPLSRKSSGSSSLISWPSPP